MSMRQKLQRLISVRVLKLRMQRMKNELIRVSGSGEGGVGRAGRSLEGWQWQILSLRHPFPAHHSVLLLAEE